MTAHDARPAGPGAAFWLLVVGGVMLMLGGFMAATKSFDALRQAAPATVPDQAVRDYALLSRSAGVLFCIAAAALIALAVRARGPDPRFRRAAIALGMAIVVIVAVAWVLAAGTNVLALLSLLPIIVGTLMLGRTATPERHADG